MPKKNEKVYLLLLGVVALGLNVTAVATEEWSVLSHSGGGKSTVGLWKACDKGMTGGANTCVDMPNNNDPNKTHFKKIALDVCRAFAIISLLLILIGLWLVVTGHKHACLFLLGGGLSSLIAMGVWAGEMLKPYNNWGNKKAMSPGYSFYLNLAGGVLAVIAGLACWRKPKGANMSKPIASGAA